MNWPDLSGISENDPTPAGVAQTIHGLVKQTHGRLPISHGKFWKTSVGAVIGAAKHELGKTRSKVGAAEAQKRKEAAISNARQKVSADVETLFDPVLKIGAAEVINQGAVQHSQSPPCPSAMKVFIDNEPVEALEQGLTVLERERADAVQGRNEADRATRWLMNSIYCVSKFWRCTPPPSWTQGGGWRIKAEQDAVWLLIECCGMSQTQALGRAADVAAGRLEQVWNFDDHDRLWKTRSDFDARTASGQIS